MPQAGKRNQLLEDGYCLFERVLPPEMVARLQEVTERLLQRQLPEDFERARATGSMIPTTGDPFFAELIAWPGALDVDSASFSTRPDEMDVPERAGDVLIGDARLLHAAHSNQTGERRTLITLWYQPDLRSLPERMQAQLAAKTQQLPSIWPREAIDRVAPLLARCEGNADPYERSLYRPCARHL